jgi:hypothetical protein
MVAPLPFRLSPSSFILHPHPPLVSEELWERCAAIREARTRQGVFNVHPDGGEVLTRRVFRAACGSPMYRNHSGRNTSRTVRYHCSGPRAAGAQHRDCDAPMALAAPIEDLLCRLRVSPDLRAALEAEARLSRPGAPTAGQN